MNTGHFYFLNNQYFNDFPDHYLMHNKENINGQIHNRPCFYAFEDTSHKGLFWLVPISSQTSKYQTIYNSKIERYHKCDTIIFGDVFYYFFTTLLLVYYFFTGFLLVLKKDIV